MSKTVVINMDGAGLEFLEKQAAKNRQLREEPLPPMPGDRTPTPNLAGKLRAEKAHRMLAGMDNQRDRPAMLAEADNARQIQELRRKRDTLKAEAARIKAGAKK